MIFFMIMGKSTGGYIMPVEPQGCDDFRSMDDYDVMAVMEVVMAMVDDEDGIGAGGGDGGGQRAGGEKEDEKFLHS